MITFPPGYVRLAIEEDRSLDQAIESVEHLLRVCRLNRFGRALIACERDETACHSAMREALRHSAASTSPIRLGVVFPKLSAALPADVRHSAQMAGVDCEVFADEASALRWLQR